MKLDELKNIGKALAATLEKIGVNSAEDLHKLGSKKAFLKMKIQLNSG